MLGDFEKQDEYGGVNLVNLECPNCGSMSISENWVEKAQVKEPKQALDEYAKTKIKNPPSQGLYLVTDCGYEYKNYVQFNLKCDKCGYTKVYEVDGK